MDVLVIAVLVFIGIMSLVLLERRRRRQEKQHKQYMEWHDQEARRALDTKRQAQQAAHDVNLAALAHFKAFLRHDGDTCYSRRSYYPLFLWEFGSDLPVLRWKDGMKPVPLDEMTIVANLSEESFEERRLWIHSIPLGDEVRVLIRPSCAPPVGPMGTHTGERLKGHMVLYMNNQCQITGIRNASTTDGGYV